MTLSLSLATRLLGASALALAAFGAQAHDLRVGVIAIDPSVSTDGFKGQNALGSLLAQPGYSATLGRATTALVTYQHRIGESLGVELVLGVPPKHDIIGAGTLAPGQTIGSLKQFSPALLFNYHFADSKATWRPVVGIGPLYSTIRDIKVDPTVQPHTTASANSRWGLAAQVGLGYAIDANWHVQGSLGYTRVNNVLTLTTDTSKMPYPALGLPPGQAISTLDVTTKNSTVSLTLGYSF